ncbi:major facilitator superfamily domain-containing protein [Spinellus fusiger]|nr:major facilitator superfamily domain-containing protein [Spinellus fusiger]
MNPLTCTELASEENIGHLNSRSSTYNSSDNTISKEIDTENIATKDEKQDISDGGYGWIIVLASFLVQLPSLSVVMSWGVFQDYYEQHMFGRSPAITLQLTFVGTLGNILLNISSPFVQILLCYMGTRKTLVVGVMLASLGMILASFSSQIWHLCLALGVLYGIGTSIIYFVVISEIPKWFTKHTGIALGIASSGNGIGGLAMPLLVAILNDKLGVEWCFRVLGFINIGVGLLTCIMFRERPGETKTCPRLRDIVDFSILKDFNFLLWCIADIFLEGAYYVPFFFCHVPYATYLGLSPDKGSITVALVSGLSSIGRIIAGLIADKLGHMNVTISFSVIAGLLSLFLWTFAESFIVLIIFSVFFGFFGGVFVTLTPSITAAITGKERYESGISLLLVVTTFAMFGPNLAGAIESSMPSTVTPFMSYKMFTGAMYMAGSLLLIFLKLRLTRWSLFKKI